MKESKILIFICLLVLGAMVGLYFAFSGSDSSKSVAPQNLTREDSHTSGTGPVKVVEFADFQCPACQAAAPELIRLETEIKDRVKLVFRHFPLPMHKNAQISAQAAEAAGAQGKFWEMNELLYLKQLEWSESARPLEQFKTYAAQLGLDVEKFVATVQAVEFQEKINRDIEDASTLGVNSTPTIYVNGKKFEGAVTFENLKTAVEEAK